MDDTAARIAENLAQVRERIAAAARDSGRAADSVRLVAATKYVGLTEIRALLAAGCRDFGESRPQDLWEKSGGITGPEVRWHLIGHLQRNKVRRTLGLVSLMHSVDSQRLIEAIQATAIELNLRVPALLEVNVSGDEAKHGFAPQEIEPLFARLVEYDRVQVHGLMCMAGLTADAAQARRDFTKLRELRDRLRPACPNGVSLDELSMGMSGDFEDAIREGATIVRIGSALFEGIGGLER